MANLLGYAFTGFLVMIALREMSVYLLHKKGFAGAEPAFGLAVGWKLELPMKYLFAPASKIDADCTVLQYWTRSVSPEVTTGLLSSLATTNRSGIRSCVCYIQPAVSLSFTVMRIPFERMGCV